MLACHTLTALASQGPREQTTMGQGAICTLMNSAAKWRDDKIAMEHGGDFVKVRA